MATNAAARAMVNHQFRLAARPVGMVRRGDFNYVEEAVREPKEGELLVEKRFPTIWMPPKEQLDLRALLLHRHTGCVCKA